MTAALQVEHMSLISRHYVVGKADAQPVETAQQAIDALVEDFDLLEDWTERYQHIIDMGRKLPLLPAEWQVSAHLLHGCQSQVWLVLSGNKNALTINAVSDSAIVSGLIAILKRVYSGRTAAEILSVDPAFLGQLGLNDHLSPTRRNGLHAMLQAIRTIAAALGAAND